MIFPAERTANETVLADRPWGNDGRPDGRTGDRPDGGAAHHRTDSVGDAGRLHLGTRIRAVVRPSGRSAAARWQPEPGTDWQWQLSGRLDTTVDAPVYDIDGFDHDAAQVAELHRKGRKVICYLSTGAWEEFRPDAAKFPTAVLGKGNGWKGSAGSTSGAPTSWNR